MDLPFPEATIEYFHNFINTRLSYDPQKPPHKFLVNLMELFTQENSYGFERYLRSGEYALYRDEADQKRVYQANCTTIIPDLYLSCVLFGIKTEIVQFRGFNHYQDLRKKKSSLTEDGHFSLIAEIGEDKYLVDPFYHCFGKIVEEDEHHLKINSSSKFKGGQREFQQMVRYSPKDFSNLMERLKKPEHALEMLIAGQRLIEPVKSSANLYHVNVYYEDSSNSIFTRAYLDHDFFQNKAIFTRQFFDEKGHITNKEVQFYFAENYMWEQLVNPKFVGKLSFSELKKVKHQFQQVTHQNKKPRLCRFGTTLNYASHHEQKSILLRTSENLLEKFSQEDYNALKPFILARTIYESEQNKKDYYFSSEERNSFITSKLEEYLDLEQKATALLHQSHFAECELLKLNSLEKRRLTLKRQQYEKDGLVLSSYYGWTFVQKDRPHLYNSVLDQLMFSKNVLKGKNLDDLEKEVSKKGFDPRIGYLSLLHDFVDYCKPSSLEILTLKYYLEDIGTKVRARRKMFSEESLNKN